MELVQLVLGCGLVFLGTVVFSMGWRLYHAPAAQMARIIRDRLNIPAPFFQEPGVIEMLAGGFGAGVGVFLVLITFRSGR